MKNTVSHKLAKQLILMGVGATYVLDGLIMVLSFGFVKPRAFIWYAKRYAHKAKETKAKRKRK